MAGSGYGSLRSLAVGHRSDADKLNVLDLYSLSLQGTASKLIELCLGARDFPVEEVAAAALGPRVHHASVQIKTMGLWRPSLDPLRLH